MYRELKGSKDISILLVEKNLNPYGVGVTEHNIISNGFSIHHHGYNVEMVWSIKEHNFEDFEDFLQKAEKIRDDDISKIEDEFIREHAENRKPNYKLLRRTPIHSVDDLAVYHFILLGKDTLTDFSL